MTCPWCELELAVSFDGRDEGQCPECLTSWCLEDEEVELALAA